jgi:hypothetical protein
VAVMPRSAHWPNTLPRRKRSLLEVSRVPPTTVLLFSSPEVHRFKAYQSEI